MGCSLSVHYFIIINTAHKGYIPAKKSGFLSTILGNVLSFNLFRVVSLDLMGGFIIGRDNIEVSPAYNLLIIHLFLCDE